MPTPIKVFYDGSCPQCRKDRRFYQRLENTTLPSVQWFDITNQDDYLITLGIEPAKALTELHLQMPDGKIYSELDAYLILMRRVSALKWLAWLISLPIIRPCLAKYYHYRVEKRLKKSGRLSN